VRLILVKETLGAYTSYEHARLCFLLSVFRVKTNTS